MIRPCPADFCIKKGCQTTKKKETNRIRPQLFIFFSVFLSGPMRNRKGHGTQAHLVESVCLSFFSTQIEGRQ